MSFTKEELYEIEKVFDIFNITEKELKKEGGEKQKNE